MISLIICTYNRDVYIYNTLRCIAENRYNPRQYEIVLVNNNSTDDTEKECLRFQKEYPEAPYRYFIETKQGLSHARNRGVQEAKGNTLVFLDDDSFVNEHYLEHLERYLKEYPDMMAFGGKITPLFETGIPPKWLSRWTYTLVSAINLGNQVTLFKGKQYPIGANMGFTKMCLERYGVFNPELGRSKKNLMAGEEKDLFNRIKGGEEKIYYFPEITVQHVIPESRTTVAYIKKMGMGIGMSERLRTLSISRGKFVKRIGAEIFKWGASLILCIGYMILLKPQKGIILFQLRWNVTKGLLKSGI